MRCRITDNMSTLYRSRDMVNLRRYRLMLTVGAVLMFLSIVGLGTIGGFLWLSRVGP